MEVPSGFATDFLNAAFDGDFLTIRRLAAIFENGEGPGKVSYANLKTGEGRTALDMAAAAGQTSICRFLLEELNFDINATTDTGETALFPAVTFGHQPAVIYLILKGADVNKSCNKGITPLHRAAEKGFVEIMKLLISKGADVCAIAQTGMPLHFAASEGKPDALKFLLDLKADPNFIAPLHCTPLQMAISAKSLECVELLLKAGANVNGDTSQSQLVPLGVAITNEDEEMIRYLLKAGADPNMIDHTGMTALEHAAMSGRHEFVELLYPFTSPIACYPDWSISGIMQYEISKEAVEHRKLQAKNLFLRANAKAKEAFQAKDFLEAMFWFTHAISTYLVDGRLYFNRSLCWTQLNDGEAALADARMCVDLEPNWPKSHFREGAALKALKRYEEAAEAFSCALDLEPDNEKYESAYKEALDECNKGSD